METDLGYVQYEYHWADGRYYRRLLYGPAHWQVWDGLWREERNPP